jgi:starch phosphorylase
MDLNDASASPPETTGRRSGDDPVLDLKLRILDKLNYSVGKTPSAARPRDWFVATALAVRNVAVDNWSASRDASKASGAKRVYYLSLEFLIGRLLMDTIGNLGITETVRAALASCGVDLDDVAREEPDAALGNGGLGRLAACFMESLATLGINACGYGIRYEHGLFRQVIDHGVQLELPEDWLSRGNPWEFERIEISHDIGFGGYVGVEPHPDGWGVRFVWHPAEIVRAVAYDMPVVGFASTQTNTLRLWAARATTALDLAGFNKGDHVGALRERVQVEAISRVLYPGDDSPAGQELRLRQEFFFASASLQDMIRRHLGSHGSLMNLPDKVAVQLNDTHPAISIAELMRLLVDVHHIAWERAWEITVATFSYTNHTLLPEALETWPVPLMERLLPRQMQIIYMLNAQHLERARAAGLDDAALARVSLVDEGEGRRIRMGHLSFLGSHAINGVSALHSKLVEQFLFPDLAELYPGRITNKTNGITFRRWLHRSNPGLTELLVETLGDGVLRDETLLVGLEAYAEDAGFQHAFAAQRAERKRVLARIIAERTGVLVDTAAMFDVQVKRLHEYKRQLLNIIQTVALYDAIRAQPMNDWSPRVKIFAGKAAPGYWRAKSIIRLIHDVAQVVNNDPVVAGRLKVIYLPNYNVSLAENIMPAADLSEQISTAGMEASGTGNMKFALNGALTIGTLDGANVEIRDHVGADNIFIFGMTVEQVAERTAKGLDARDIVAKSPALAQALQSIAMGAFSSGDPTRYQDLMTQVARHDSFMVAADFESYWQTQGLVAETWRDPARWWQMAVLNTARVAWFSSDRTIREYATEIWNVGLPSTRAQASERLG